MANPLEQYMPTSTGSVNPLAEYMPTNAVAPATAEPANPLEEHMGDPSDPLNDYKPKGVVRRPIPRIDLPPNIESKLKEIQHPTFGRRLQNIVLGGGGGSLNTMALNKELKSWNLNKEQENEVYQRLATSSLKDGLALLEIAPRFYYGQLKGATLNAPELVTNLAGIKDEPLSVYGDISEKIGTLFGISKGIKLLGRLGAFKTWGAWAPASTKAVMAKRLLEGGFKLGTHSMLSEHGGATLLENAQRRGEGFLSGGALGAFFAGMGTITPGAVQKTGEVLKLKNIAAMPDSYAKMTAFLMRLGGNQYVTGIPAYNRYKKNEESLPGLIYEIGLGTMFSMADNPITMEANFNKHVKRQYKLKKMTVESMEAEFVKIGDRRKIPKDLKWAYIMKTSGIKPREQNIGSGDYIFNNLIRMGKPELYHKLKLAEDVQLGIEAELSKVFENELKKATETETKITKEVRREQKRIDSGIKEKIVDEITIVPKKTTGKTKETDLRIRQKKIQVDVGKERRRQVIEDVHALRLERKRMLDEANREKDPAKQKELLREAVEISDTIKNLYKPEYETIEYSTDKAVVIYSGKEVGRANYDIHGDNVRIGQVEVDTGYQQGGAGASLIRKIITDAKKKNKNVKNISTRVTSEGGVNLMRKFGAEFTEADTGMVISSQIAKDLLAEGRGVESNINLMSKEFTLSKAGKANPWLTWIPKSYATQEKTLEVQMGGKGKIPKNKQIMSMDMVEWMDRGGNWFDWMQSARIPLRPIYDFVKPAYVEYINAREKQIDKLRSIYGGKVKPGSAISKQLALYSDGKIPLDKLPLEYREIALGRQKFYADYADRLIEAGLLNKDKVFNKDGTRKPYYHRYMDAMVERIYQAGFTTEDYWIPGEMPLAGPLRKRKGGKAVEYNAVESDRRYIYAMEKYLNMHKAMTVSSDIAGKLTGMRKDMANVYIRGMRGQPTKTDQYIKESMQSIAGNTATLLDKAGYKDTAQKLRDWEAPAFATSRATSPLARFYYWRYVGLAVDTSLKNSVQWHHAVARYGIENVNEAFYLQFDPKYKEIIRESGILDEGIRRGGHLISENKLQKTVGAMETGSYAMWGVFDKNNRQVSGLAAYLKARKSNKSHDTALQEMKNGSHETQFGYTKADSLLMDMYTPLSRFILFKKWPLAKVEMIRQWNRDGHGDAIMNLAITEMVMYQTARSAGVDLGPYFSGIWRLASSLSTFGEEDPKRMIPVLSELGDVYKAFGSGSDGRKARERLVRAWQGGGNRYLGKVVDVWKMAKNDWKVRDSEGRLKWEVTPKEAYTGLLYRPMELSRRLEEIGKMAEIGDKVSAMRREIVQLIVEDDMDGAMKLEKKMLKEYGDEYTDKYGKAIQNVTADDVRSYLRIKDIPMTERIRRRLPGRGVKLPPGESYQAPAEPPSMLESLRGY